MEVYIIIIIYAETVGSKFKTQHGTNKQWPCIIVVENIFMAVANCCVTVDSVPAEQQEFFTATYMVGVISSSKLFVQLLLACQTLHYTYVMYTVPMWEHLGGLYMGVTGKETSNFCKTMSCFSGSVAVLNISSSLKCPTLISKHPFYFSMRLCKQGRDTPKYYFVVI